MTLYRFQNICCRNCHVMYYDNQNNHRKHLELFHSNLQFISSSVLKNQNNKGEVQETNLMIQEIEIGKQNPMNGVEDATSSIDGACFL